MGSSSRFMEGMSRVIHGEDFPPLHGASRVSDTGTRQGASSRVSPPCDSSNPPSAGGVHGTSRVLSDGIQQSTGPAASSRVSPPLVPSNSLAAGGVHGVPRDSSDAAGPFGSMEGGASFGSQSGVSSWKSLFSSEVQLTFVTPILKDGKKYVRISKSSYY